MKTTLALEDGRIFAGDGFGAQGETSGEVVFNTGLSGYQEILTDPSYHGQIVVMTSPLIGNTGTNDEDGESHKIQVRGFVVREKSRMPSNFRNQKDLHGYLKEQNIVALTEVDTRAITRHIRSLGAMRGVISSMPGHDPKKLVEKAKKIPPIKGQDMAAKVTCKEKKEYTQGLWELGKGFKAIKDTKFTVAALDLGIKTNIIRHLGERGCRVIKLPASTPADEIMALGVDGLFLSNGPGDPDAVPYAAKTVKDLLGKVPIFGICLGHQILCLALGATTFKLKFGHRGINHPVIDLENGNIVHITSQNHGFAVDLKSLPGELELTLKSLYDGTVEGVRHKKLPAFSVQYHPEAAPGPHDTFPHFDRFMKMMEERKA
ncbi:MAG: glutamine-hydrolyzing carbamoyl-phosphate synthase small subunit [Nitrospinota bacterium]